MNQSAADIYLDDNHSHSQIVKRVPRYAQVLELGCGDGSMSLLLKQRCQAYIIGVEQNPQAAWQAQRHCDYVFTENLDDPRSLDALEGEKFDIVTLSDVLEHLQHPRELLERLKPLLLDEGKILLSVPNIAHASVRLELLNGGFTYEQAGILDVTHLRFFTSETLQALLLDAGYVVDEVTYTWHDLPDEVIREKLEAAGLAATPEAVAAFHSPEAVAYQFIITASPVLQSTAPKQHFVQPLKPMEASWRGWGQVHGELQDARAELERVYATRSWRMLRRGASLWRTLFSHGSHLPDTLGKT